MAFFRADVARIDVLLTAGAFIARLICVVVSQVCAFFTMSTRSEAAQQLSFEQLNRVAALAFPQQTPENIARTAAADANQTSANARSRLSNIWRMIGLFFFISSTVVFIAGCVLGGKAILLAKGKPALTSSASK
jgi:uncharacterized membrane protein